MTAIRLRALIISIALLSLASCDRLRGPESRELAGGYRLKKVDGSSDFALIIPHGTGGMIVDEIGWREPLIVARGNGSQYWEVINTARAEHSRVSDDTLKSDKVYNSIQTVPAEKAWSSLKPDATIW